ncbi:MAG: DUF429 domain-containing protein [Balneolaceae bacterium]|nr:MAG: DUF429 domain-containing protein [Balneolaceae bacterium]
MIIVAHADWGTDPNKQWMAVARGSDINNLLLHTPERVLSARSLVKELCGNTDAQLFMGFDFPIGVPLAYAKRLRIISFRELLENAGRGSLSKFFDLAETARDVSMYRPFYPKRPGGTLRKHLVEGLGVDSFHDLLRHCDRATRSRGAACALFWTLGGQQAGKAAISGWREILQPAITDPSTDIALWPFDGDLDELLRTKQIVAAETYPAEAAIQIGLGVPGRGWSKRSVNDRISKAETILSYAVKIDVSLSKELRNDIGGGFGTGKHGEDRFDATIGLLSMIGVMKGLRSSGTPPSDEVRAIEGWILGQETSQ